MGGVPGNYLIQSANSIAQWYGREHDKESTSRLIGVLSQTWTARANLYYANTGAWAVFYLVYVGAMCCADFY